MGQPTVLFEKRDAVGMITLNRPEVLNALNLQLANELVAALERCQKDRSIKAAVITGAGSAFCSGGDLPWLRSLGEEDGDPAEGFRQATKQLNRIIIEIRRSTKPVIAAINGAVAGGGLSVAMACDLRIASANAKFKQAYTSVGLTPDGGWLLLMTTLAGLTKISEMLFFDPVIDAQQALQMGLVNKVVAPGELEAAALEWAQRLAAGPVLSFREVKNLINEFLFILLERQLEIERQSMVRVASSRDFQEGVAAFFEKRQPKFVGE